MAYEIQLDPLTNAKLVIKLFRNVTNVPDLRQQLIAGTLKCCIVKPKLIADPFVIALAANKALCAEKMTTRSVYTEILFNLSVSKNITQSLQLFGIDDRENDVLVVTIDGGEDVFGGIKGVEVDIGEVIKIRDVKAIQKAYKLKEGEIGEDMLVDAVCNRIAIKDFS